MNILSWVVKKMKKKMFVIISEIGNRMRIWLKLAIFRPLDTQSVIRKYYNL